MAKLQKVLIFGRGKLYEEKEEYIKKNFIVKGFIDNDIGTDKMSTDVTNISVFHPEDVVKYFKDDMIIVLMSYQYCEMWEQLSKLGIKKEKIMFGVMFPPLSDSEEILFGDGGFLSAEESGEVSYWKRNEKIRVNSHKQIQKMVQESLREQYRKKYPIINAISNMDKKPISKKFGLERGQAIDRYYVEKFLEENQEFICGDCLEIAENTYTLRYGKERVRNSYMLHVEGWGINVIKGNLETGEGIAENKYDCAIITQTLMFIFDIGKAVENIYKMLKEGGHALITVAGISQISRYDADRWGSYYGFHEDAMRRFFEPVFGEENVKVETYGNVKTAMAMLCGLCREDLSEDDFMNQDRDYPVIISIFVEKNRERK